MSQTTEKTLLVVILVILGIFALFPISSYFFFGRLGVIHPPFHPWFLPAILVPTVLLFILWLLVVVWVYRDAERRTMSGILWALLVFFGNFIGLLIYLIVRSEGLPKRMAAGVSQPCPGCGKAVQQLYAYCPHCGAQLKAVCPNCDKPVASDWKVCPHCGQKLPEEK